VSHGAVSGSDLALPFARPLFRAALKAADRFTKQVFLAREQADTLTLRIILTGFYQAIGFAPEDLADGGLGDAQFGGDLTLRPPRRIQLPGALRA